MSRHEAVLIRVSTDDQDHKGQIENVKQMLTARGATVAEPYWSIYTVSRSKVATSDEFKKFIAQVEADEISTAYVESRDRFGQTDSYEYFSIIATLRAHGTRLVALREGADLTRDGIADDVLAVTGAHNNREKLRQTAYQSTRTRVSNFKATGSWPTGPAPFGYGKACFGAGGGLRWVWMPVSRTRGLTYDANADGGVRSEPREVTPGKIPRKERTDIIKLRPSDDPKKIKAIRRVFELYTEVALSRRGISKRLNEEGFTYYGKPFTHSLVTAILENPAYVGDTHFGKSRVGDHYSFDSGGQICEIEKRPGNGKVEKQRRGEDERVVVKGTHPPLIKERVWERAKEKLATEREQPGFAPRNPAYFLKNILHCGHCGKHMAGRTDNGAVVYVCATYRNAQANGQKCECGFHTIKHDVAEQMLLDKLAEQNVEFDRVMSAGARENLEERLARLGNGEDFDREFQAHATEGIDALAGFLAEEYGIEYPAIQRVRRLALDHFYEDPPGATRFNRLPFDLADFREAVTKVEAGLVAEAERRIEEATEAVERYTIAWVEAVGDQQRVVLKRKADEAEGELNAWRPRTVPLGERIETLFHRERQQRAERERLLAEVPTLEYRARGEAFSRLFKRVDLYWDRKWVAARPGTPKRTNRTGRYKYTLRHDLTEWEMASTDLGGTW